MHAVRIVQKHELLLLSSANVCRPKAALANCFSARCSASAAVPCQADDTFTMRSTASCRVAIDDANEKRMKSFPVGPKAAPGIAATPASSSRMRHRFFGSHARASDIDPGIERAFRRLAAEAGHAIQVAARTARGGGRIRRPCAACCLRGRAARRWRHTA